MLYEFFCFLFCIVCFLTIFFVSVQKSQGGFFSGQNSNDSSILFGGSGGMEILQKITWVLGFFLISGTLFLSIYKTKASTTRSYFKEQDKIVTTDNKIDENTELKNEFIDEKNNKKENSENLININAKNTQNNLETKKN